jgi:oxygen-independent coproporphyrinogen-3 oxidase
VHVPFCYHGKCDYCDFYSVPVTVRDTRIPSYIDQILEDAEALLDELRVTNIPTLYFGGGTPSVLGAQGIGLLVGGLSEIIKKNTTSETPAEITVEANPETCDEAFLMACKDLGVTRMSLGIQTFNQASRQAVHRAGEEELLSGRLKLASEIFPCSFSVDLISGLPFQDEEILRKDIEKTLAFNPAHVSLYSLTIAPETPLGIRAGNDPIMGKDEADKLWITGRDMLEKNGYEQYEVSNFCLPGKESLHNLRYWRMENWHGLGPSASGTIIDTDKGTGRRFTAAPDIDLWLKRKPNKEIPGTRENLDTLTVIKETLLMGFRLLKGPEVISFQRCFKKSIEELLPKTLKAWRNQGLLLQDRPALTKEGLLLLDLFLVEAFKELEEVNSRTFNQQAVLKLAHKSVRYLGTNSKY